MEKKKGEVVTRAIEPKSHDVLSKAMWYAEYLAASMPKPVERTDVVHFPKLVFEYLTLVLNVYGDAFLKLSKTTTGVEASVLTPQEVTPITNDGVTVGYYLGLLPEDGDLDETKLYRTDEILYLQGGVK